jgi:hypothetical protein
MPDSMTDSLQNCSSVQYYIISAGTATNTFALLIYLIIFYKGERQRGY